MPKPVCPNMATATPLGSPGPQTAQKQHAGSLEVDAQPSAARIHLPEGAAQTVSASVRRAYIRDTSAASGPEPGPGRTPIPGDGAAAQRPADGPAVADGGCLRRR